MKFSDLGLGPEILNAVEDAGYSQPTPIQEQAIPVVLQGRDVLGGAQTGTGKTASFTLPMIEILAAGQAKARMPRSLILEPTRELATQVAENFVVYGKYHKLTMALLIGGVSYDEQDRKLDRGVDVLIATPGRLLDHIERGKILLGGVRILVIDEADRMLDMGFIPDIEKIVGMLPKMRQTLLFSATMPPVIRRLADAFLMNPKEITVDPPSSPAELVVQGLAVVERGDKREALRRLIRAQNVKNALIFCNRKRDVDILYRSLKRHGFDVAALHGDMAQSVRTETLEAFKEGEVTLLVASDVAARGLDIQGMSHVFNFDVPTHAEDYIHRIGRTGRAGLPGKAYTLATPDEGKYVAAIVRLIGKRIPAVEIDDISQFELHGEDERGRRRGGRGGGKADEAGGRKPKRRPASRRQAGARSEPAKDAERPRRGRRGRKTDEAKGREAKGREAEGREAKGREAKQEVARGEASGADERPYGKAAERRPEGEREDKRERPARGGKGKQKEAVVGMGEHVPAFMRRPGRSRPK